MEAEERREKASSVGTRCCTSTSGRGELTEYMRLWAWKAHHRDGQTDPHKHNVNKKTVISMLSVLESKETPFRAKREENGKAYTPD